MRISEFGKLLSEEVVGIAHLRCARFSEGPLFTAYSCCEESVQHCSGLTSDLWLKNTKCEKRGVLLV